MIRSFCPDHGFGVEVEMGCCEVCGALATGAGVVRLFGALTGEQLADLAKPVAPAAPGVFEAPAVPEAVELDPLEGLDPDVVDFVIGCDALLGRVDDLPTRAGDFAEGVRERIDGMRAWAIERNHVTAKMTQALDNMDAGVGRWER